MRVGHVRDEADPAGEKARILLCAGSTLGKFGRELAADGRDVHADLFEHFPGHLPADPAAAGPAAHVGTLPRCIDETGVAAGLAFDLLECGADAIAQGFEPIARGLLL